MSEPEVPPNPMLTNSNLYIPTSKRRVIDKNKHQTHDITTIPDNNNSIQEHSTLSSSTNAQEPLFYYPSSAPGNVAVVREDANRLKEGQMLNDSIIDFYVKWLLTNASISEDEQPITERVHIFNTFFFARLKQSTRDDPYEDVKKWTLKINLFEKDFVSVPVHEAIHWYLFVVCNLKKCILDEAECIDLSYDENDKSDDKAIIYSLDSMGMKRTRSANRVIKYLEAAAKDRLGVDADQFRKPVYIQATNVPLQPNAYDCGIYMLHFIEVFFEHAKKMEPILTEKQINHALWKSESIKNKRKHISDLVTKLDQTQQHR
ncbi:hypothetical protein BDC45DRAFT_566660 [Circinella umbellata]|nr:hypothetical protein BDC45DRAFT_566660 [Circinella umbellata]